MPNFEALTGVSLTPEEQQEVEIKAVDNAKQIEQERTDYSAYEELPFYEQYGKTAQAGWESFKGGIKKGVAAYANNPANYQTVGQGYGQSFTPQDIQQHKENVIEETKTDIIPKINKSADKNFDKASELSKGAHGIWSDMGHMTVNTGQILAVMGVHTFAPELSVPADVAYFGSLGLSAYGGGVREVEEYQKSKGEDPYDKKFDALKTSVGTASAIFEMAPEMLLGGLSKYMPETVSKGLTTSLYKKLMAKDGGVAVDNALRRFATEQPKMYQKAMKSTATFIDDGAKEGIDEATTEALNICKDYVYKEVGDKPELKEIWERELQAFKGGLLMTGMLHGPSHLAKNYVTNRVRDSRGVNLATVGDEVFEVTHVEEKTFDEETDTPLAQPEYIVHGMKTDGTEVSFKPEQIEDQATLTHDEFKEYVKGMKKGQEMKAMEEVAQLRNQSTGRIEMALSINQREDEMPFYILNEHPDGTVVIMDAETGARRMIKASEINSETRQVIDDQQILQSMTPQEAEVETTNQAPDATQLAPMQSQYQVGQTVQINGMAGVVSDMSSDGRMVVETAQGSIEATADQLKPVQTLTDGKEQYAGIENEDGSLSVGDAMYDQNKAQKKAEQLNTLYQGKRTFEVQSNPSGDVNTPDTYQIVSREVTAEPEQQAEEQPQAIEQAETGAELPPPPNVVNDGNGNITPVEAQEANTTPVYAHKGEAVSKSYIKGLIRTADSKEDLEGVQIENDEELLGMVEAKFPTPKQAYTYDGEVIDRDEAMGIIAGAKKPEHLAGLNIENDEELQQSAQAKFAPVAETTPIEATNEILPQQEPTSSDKGKTLSFYHGGLSDDFSLESLDTNRLAEKQQKKGRNYAGFYMYDESGKEGARIYSEQTGKGLHRFDVDANARILQLGNIERVSQSQLDEYRNQGYDMIQGKDVRGRVEYVLLNKDVVKRVENEKAKPQHAGEFLDNHATNKEISQAETNVHTEPTEAQKEAGNYKKGHVNIQGLDITIENPKGSKRAGTDTKGNKWEVTMNNTYGYFKRTMGKDGDQVDVFMGDKPNSKKVFVVDQVNENGEFDEHKVMMGFDTKEEAAENYNKNYSEGWTGLGNITEMGIDEFKVWLKDGERTTQPAAAQETEDTKPVLKGVYRTPRKAEFKGNSRRGKLANAEPLSLKHAILNYFISGGKVTSEFFKRELSKAPGEVSPRLGLFNNTTGVNAADVMQEQMKGQTHFADVQESEFIETLHEVLWGHKSVGSMMNEAEGIIGKQSNQEELNADEQRAVEEREWMEQEEFEAQKISDEKAILYIEQENTYNEIRAYEQSNNGTAQAGSPHQNRDGKNIESQARPDTGGDTGIDGSIHGRGVARDQASESTSGNANGNDGKLREDVRTAGEFIDGRIKEKEAVIPVKQLEAIISQSPTKDREAFENETLKDFAHLIKPNESITARELAERVRTSFDQNNPKNKVAYSTLFHMGDVMLEGKANGVYKNGRHKGNHIEATRKETTQNEELNENQVNEKKQRYETKEGKTIQYQLAFDYDNRERNDQLQQGKNRDNNPSLRQLKAGERSAVELKYTADKNFIFNGKNKIESTDDVAYLFRQLEAKAVENLFACLVDENGKGTVIHISMGGRAGTVSELATLADAIHRMQPSKVYLIHNHPSGNLAHSDADVKTHRAAIDAFGDVMGEHVILNTTSGQYATFKFGLDHEIKDRPTQMNDEVRDYRVIKMDKQIYRSNTKLGKITDSRAVANFLTAQRFSDGGKISVLVLAQNNSINAYIHTPFTELTYENKDGIVKELQAYGGRFGGRTMVLATNAPLTAKEIEVVKAVNRTLKESGFGILDVVSITNGINYSASNEGILEPEESYKKNSQGTEGVLFKKDQNQSHLTDKEVETRKALIEKKVEEQIEAIEGILTNAEMAKRTHVCADMGEVIEQMKLNGESQRMIENVEQAGNVNGFITSKGVYLNASAHQTTEGIIKTFIHEQIGHYGLDKLLDSLGVNKSEFYNRVYESVGEKGFERICNEIDEQDGSEIGATYKAYKDETPETKGKEYMAFLAEKVIEGKDLTPVERSWWDVIRDYIERFILDNYKKGVTFSDKELALLVRTASYEILGKTATTTPTKEVFGLTVSNTGRGDDSVLLALKGSGSYETQITGELQRPEFVEKLRTETLKGKALALHGGAILFNKPDNKFIGLGAGEKIHGYGHYSTLMTTDTSIPELYGRKTFEHTPIFKAYAERITEELGQGAYKKFVNAYLGVRGDESKLQDRLSRDLEKSKYAQPLLDFIKEHPFPTGNRFIYSYAIDPIAGEFTMIDWYHAMTDNAIWYTTLNALKGKEKTFLGHLSDQMAQSEVSYFTGGEFYGALSKTLGGDKEASEFLNGLGVDGVVYFDKEIQDGKERINIVSFDGDKIDVIDKPIQFKTKDEKKNKLVALHNIDESTLNRVLSNGGMIAPSIAITDVNNPYTDFGGITLIGNKQLIDPTNGDVKVFAGDVYSPTVPQPQFKLDKGFDKWATKMMNKAYDIHPSLHNVLANEVGDYGRLYKDLQRDTPENIVKNNKDNADLKLLYLIEKGVEFKAPEREKPYYMFSNMAVSLTEAEKAQAKEMWDQHQDDNAFYESDEFKGFVMGITERTLSEKYADAKDTHKLATMSVENNLSFSTWCNIRNGIQTIKELDEQALKNTVKEKTDQVDYEKWLTEKLNEYQGEKYFTVGNKKLPYTADNLLNVIIGKTRGQESLMTFGMNKARSFSLKQFKTIDAMKKIQDILVSKEEMSKVDEAYNAEYFLVADKLKYNYSNQWDKLDDLWRSLADYFKGKSAATALSKNNFDSHEGVEEFKDFADRLKANPVDYFEAKMQREVELSEFQHAIVPKETSEETIKALEGKGVKVSKYETTEERHEVVKKVTEEDELRFKKKGSEDIYFSPTERALDNIKQEKATAQQWKAMLLKNGAKEAEMEWSGLNELLSADKSFTKQELYDTLEANKIELEEVVLSDEEFNNEQALKEDQAKWEQLDEKVQQAYIQGKSQEEIEQAEADRDNWQDEMRKKKYPEKETKFSQYSTIGGKNYKEWLLTLPSKRGTQDDWSILMYGKPYEELSLNEQGNVNRKRSETKGQDFKSSHWDEPNVAVHIRTQEFTDKDGKRVLLLDEVQSDWAQEGKKKGFKRITTDKGYIEYRDELRQKYGIESVNELQKVINTDELSNLHSLYAKENGGESTVADMPFKQTPQWVSLAFRRMLRHAAENGFDTVAWSTGKQNADRYSLSKQVDKVYYNPKTLELGYFYTGERTPQVKTKVKAEQLESLIGKEVAKKLLDTPLNEDNTHELEGEGLEVGGEGMKSFYDQIIPSVVKKAFKATPKTSEIVVGEAVYAEAGDQVIDLRTGEMEANTGQNTESQTVTVHSIDLTPELKEKSLQPQPLFKKRWKESGASEAKTAGEVLEKLIQYDNNQPNHKAVQEKANAFVEKYGHPVVVVSSTHALPSHIKGKIKRGEERQIQGLIDTKTGIIYVVSNNVNPKMAEKVMMHELIGHKGLRDTLGEQINPVLKKIYDSMSETERRNFADIYGTNDPHLIAEEYVAHLAENYKRPDLLRSTLAKIREYLRNVLGLDYSLNDIMHMLSKAEGYYLQERPNKTDFDSADRYLNAIGEWDAIRAKTTSKLHTDPDIRFSKAGRPNSDLSHTGDGFIEKVQDKMITVKRLEQEVADRGGKIGEFNKVARAETLMYGRAKNAIERTSKELVDPVMRSAAEIIKAKGCTLNELQKYLKAKHAPERNRVISNRLKLQGETNQSGFETVDALQIIDTFEQGLDKALIDQVWKDINNLSRFTLDRWLKDGFISQEHYDVVSKMYQHYVPLKGYMDKDTTWDYMTRAFNNIVNPNQEAEGRQLESEDPLQNLVSMAQTAIIAGEKNRVSQHAYRLASNNSEMTDLFKVQKAWYVETDQQDAQGNYIIRETFEKPEQALFDAGKVTEKVNPKTQRIGITATQEKEHEVEVFINGQKHKVTFENPSVARALNGENVVKYEFPGFEKMAAATRWMSANLTAKNPAFIPINTMRDVAYATTAHYVKGEKGDMGRFIKNLAKAEKAMRDEQKGKGGKYVDLYKQFKENGGETGFIHSKETEELLKEVEKEIKRYSGTNSKADKVAQTALTYSTLKFWGEKMENFAIRSENLSRFATYLTALERGATPEQAAHEAKEITVNFNTKGTHAKGLGGAYAFFNASIQGGQNFMNMGLKHKGEFVKASATFMAMGFLTAMSQMAFKDDDEEKEWNNLSDYMKQNYLCVNYGKGQYISIPLPPGFRAFYGMGVMVADQTWGIKKNAVQLGLNLGSVMSGAVSPIDPVSFFKETDNGTYTVDARPIVPTIGVPLYDVWMNEDFAGRPITREPYTKVQAEQLADAGLYMKNVNGVAKWMTDRVYEMGGGDTELYRTSNINDGHYLPLSDLTDYNPSNIEHLIESYTGGRGKFFNQLQKTTFGITESAYKAIKGEDEPMADFDSNDIPILSRLNRRTPGANFQKIYYHLKEEVAKYKELKKACEDNGEYKVDNEMERKIFILEMMDKDMEDIKKLDKETLNDPGMARRNKEIKDKILKPYIKMIR